MRSIIPSDFRFARCFSTALGEIPISFASEVALSLPFSDSRVIIFSLLFIVFSLLFVGFNYLFYTICGTCLTYCVFGKSVEKMDNARTVAEPVEALSLHVTQSL